MTRRFQGGRLIIASHNPGKVTEIAELLRLELNAPTAEANCIVIDAAGIAIYVAQIIYRGDCIKFDIELTPKPS